MKKLRLISWNINGWRAVLRKGSIVDALAEIEADAWGFQEIKTQEPEIPDSVANDFAAGYHAAEKKGYSGTLNLVRKMEGNGNLTQKVPELGLFGSDLGHGLDKKTDNFGENNSFQEKAGVSISSRINEKVMFYDGFTSVLEDKNIQLDETTSKSNIDQINYTKISDEIDFTSRIASQLKIPVSGMTEKELMILNAEGRICGTSWEWSEEKLLWFNVYFPNGGMSEERLQYKMDFYAALQKVLGKLRGNWPGMIVSGDVNTAHQEVDLARPKQNSKTTGFLPMEREWISGFLADGWIDTFRMKNPEVKEAYTWWDYKTKSRERNVGWRIDYFFVTEEMRGKICEAQILPRIMGSDHCPVYLEIEI